MLRQHGHLSNAPDQKRGEDAQMEQARWPRLLNLDVRMHMEVESI